MVGYIRQTSHLLTSGEKKRFYFQLFFLIVMACVDVVGVASILPFMAIISKPELVNTTHMLRLAYDILGFHDIEHFQFFLGLAVLFLLVASNAVKAAYTWISLKYDNLLYYNLARRLLASYMARPYQYFLRTNTAEMLKNVLSEVSSVVGGVFSPALQVLSNSLLALLILVLLLIVDPFVAVSIVVVLGGAYGAVFLLVRRRLARIGSEQIVANSLKFKAAREALSAIKDLKVLGREGAFLERFSSHARRHARYNTIAGFIYQLPRYALETIAFGGILVIALYSLSAQKDIGKIIPLLSVYAFAGYRLMPALQQIFSCISAIRFNVAALENLSRNMTDDEGVVRLGQEAVFDGSQSPIPFCREMVLENITFRYSGAPQPAITGISITIAPHTWIGLAGSTGSGKTTLVDVILGLLAPSGGRLKVDQLEINEKTVRRWQQTIGYVPQSIYLADDTIARNIAFGIADDDIDMAAVKRAARLANLHGFVEELPDGFNTISGERGVRLSGGQRQRIGIARALYHEPAVLIMDEATSALDGITELAVMDALRGLSREMTVITIAHRLATVRECDMIYVLDNGSIVASGRYNELLASSDWFRTAARAGSENA